MTYDDQRLSDLECSIVKSAKQHDAKTFYRLRAVPGVGKILARVLRYELPDSRRFPSVQAFASYGRLVKGARASAGKRDGNSGPKSGQASLKWAFSEAAVLCLRNNPAGQKSRARLEKTHGQGQALTILAQKLARAVYDRRNRETVFALDKFLCGEGAQRGGAERRTGHPRDQPVSNTLPAYFGCVSERDGVYRPHGPAPLALIGHPLWRLHRRRWSHRACVCCPSPEPDTNWRAGHVQPAR